MPQLPDNEGVDSGMRVMKYHTICGGLVMYVLQYWEDWLIWIVGRFE